MSQPEIGSLEFFLQDASDIKEDNINHDLAELKEIKLGELFKLYDENKLILNTEYHRPYQWSQHAFNDLIDKVFTGQISWNIFTFKEDKDGTLTVIDGMQRLTGLILFYKNEIPYHQGDKKVYYDKAPDNISMYGQLKQKFRNTKIGLLSYTNLTRRQEFLLYESTHSYKHAN